VRNKNLKDAYNKLSLEHLKYCHPIVICLLPKLLNSFISLVHIPIGFGTSYTVPKCDGRTRALSVNDFKGISISPINSKLFEMALLHRFSDYFNTSDHQFGFKQCASCRHAIYCVRNIIESFINNGLLLMSVLFIFRRHLII